MPTTLSETCSIAGPLLGMRCPTCGAAIERFEAEVVWGKPTVFPCPACGEGVRLRSIMLQTQGDSGENLGTTMMLEPARTIQ